jgi:hypothetical protein
VNEPTLKSEDYILFDFKITILSLQLLHTKRKSGASLVFGVENDISGDFK